MKHPRLEAKRDSNEPKCANCAYWASRDTGLTLGRCENVPDGSIVPTQDLSVCSAWELHTIHYGQIVPADETID